MCSDEKENSVLNDRERRIFEARRLADDAITLEELASEFGLSRERERVSRSTLATTSGT
jgi:RNA polymerase sigma-32 factor